MSSEPERLSLYNRLGEVLGPEHADYMMQHLSPEPGDQLATKSDIARLEGRVDELAKSVRDYQRTYLMAIVGAMTAQTAIIGLIVGLFR